eukprot:m.240308 g.240308  ORF g.240308 m.240308 type:complete len:75 (+) comp23296_c0_seq1:67-291(+)
MNTGSSSALGWAAFTVATLTGLYFARVELLDRRKDQEARGVRSNEKLDFEQRMALEEQKAAAQAASTANPNPTK